MTTPLFCFISVESQTMRTIHLPANKTKMYGDNVIYYPREDKLKQKIAQPNNGEKS